MVKTRISVTIITGFLGAGKTTLLNNLISQYPEKKFAVIENELGETGIDGELIVGADNGIFELSNGCICCSLNEGFFEVIEKLLNSSYSFDYLLIETTGIADPSSIVKAFLSNERIQRYFRIDSIVCLVDALHAFDLLASEVEFRRQIVLADHLLINKTETLTTEEKEQIRTVVSGINPTATLFYTSYSAINDIQLINTGAFSAQQVEEMTLSFRNPIGMACDSLGDSPSLLKKVPGKLQHDIRAFGISIPEALNPDRFFFWLEHFLFLNQQTIFRVKGILNIQGTSERYILQAVRDIFTVEKGTSWTENAPRFSKIIFIGKDMDTQAIENGLYKLSMSNQIDASHSTLNY